MSPLENFLKSFIQTLPRIETLANQIQRKNNLFVNYPLLLKPTTSNKRTAIYSQAHIPKNSDLFLISMGECLFSSGFTGSSQSEEMQITEQIQKLTSLYQSLSKDYMERIKIFIQLLASVQELKSGLMPLKAYSEYVLNLPEKGLIKSQINSKYLLDLYHSWQFSNKITYSFMKKELLKRIQEDVFQNACQKGRLVIRSAGNSPYLYAAPFLDKIDHSFDPNCQFEMLYLPHRRSPFIRIRSIKNIEADQKPTINYGKLNNYQLLIRYGFSVKNNPNSIFMLPLNFQNIIQIFNKNIEWKQNQLLKRNMKLKNYVKIQPDGNLAQEDLTMMRILICDNQNPKQQRLQSADYDELINKFVGDHAANMRKNIKINSLKVTTNESIKILEDEQISILDAFLSRYHK